MASNGTPSLNPRRIPPERPGPPGGKRDRNRRQRTDALLRAGLHLFLERGIEPVTVDDIAGDAGMVKGNFYRYFRHKSELVETLLEPVAERTRHALHECADGIAQAQEPHELLSAYERLAAALGETLTSHPEVTRLYLQERRSPAVGARTPIRHLAEHVCDQAVHLTRVAVEHELLRVGDPRISALAVVGAAEELALTVLQGNLEVPPEEIGATLISIVMEGIRGG